jgi:hypothetical protein
MSIPILATFKPVYSFLSWPYQIFCKSYPQLEIISSPLSPSLVNAKPSNSGKLTELCSFKRALAAKILISLLKGLVSLVRSNFFKTTYLTSGI